MEPATNFEHARRILRVTHRSLTNVLNVGRKYRGEPYHFGTPKVEASSESVVRRIMNETNLTPAQLFEWAERGART